MKVLIVDDEFLVRMGLKSIIPWEEKGFTLLGDAKNGAEAIDMFNETQPDILLTDISMPFMDGLELIRILKGKSPSLKVIILSNYDDFKYAQKGIQLGVNEYILKHEISPEKILAALESVTGPAGGSEFPAAAAGRKDYSTQLYHLMVKDNLSEQEKEDVLNTLKKDLQGSYFTVISMLLQFSGTEADSRDLTREETIEKLALETLKGKDFQVFSLLRKNEVLFIVNTSEAGGINERIKKMMHTVKNNTKQFLNRNLFIGISSAGGGLEELRMLYEQSKTAREQSFFSNDIMVCSEERVMEQDNGALPRLDMEQLNKLVKLKDTGRVEKFLLDVFDILYNLQSVAAVQNIFQRLIKDNAELFAANNLILNQQSFGDFSGFEDVRQYVIDVYKKNCLHNERNIHSVHITKSIHYLKKNYSDNISLSQLADYLQINKSYLSLLFKQEIGVNFTNYLNNIRIEKAKELLLHSNYKAYEIAKQIGFDNPYYFSKVFKETTGMNCQEFKRTSASLGHDR
ncbi:AraC family transcriptional regulator [Paenibacillus darwinianus]|uniref:AraC family transcriptional regulator n=1 Tax=Paenibacillus darwinianus TaxID=1380763 RepID=A0A9W5W865_9BACL|nr:response regulator [Paenibacillus darwinianus]EXX91648.1 AraC family transcriptional regulator [Paenibacillus darwinianus]EXX91791.1 AraC family transcriptional regulator [Paenibacillus darwinianus]EXX92403.1 AraC family transcriptional regulator [Paenibacillus darwinianus]